MDLAILGTADRVWCMDKEHRSELEPYFQERPNDLELFDPEGQGVDDPYRRSMRQYRRIAKRIEAIARKRIEQLTGS